MSTPGECFGNVVVIRRNGNDGNYFPLHDTAVIGRHKECDIRVALPVVSRFHAELRIDENGRVLKEDGSPFANLYAAGGAARGVSGDGADGYMAGNGLLTATTFGKLAGRAASNSSC